VARPARAVSAVVVGSARVGERRRGSRRSVGAQEQGDGALVAARCARLRPRARVACALAACAIAVRVRAARLRAGRVVCLRSIRLDRAHFARQRRRHGGGAPARALCLRCAGLRCAR